MTTLHVLLFAGASAGTVIRPAWVLAAAAGAALAQLAGLGGPA